MKIENYLTGSTRDTVSASDAVVVSGFGHLNSNNNPINSRLNYVTLNVMGNQECKRRIDQKYSSRSKWQYHSNTICTWRSVRNILISNLRRPKGKIVNFMKFFKKMDWGYNFEKKKNKKSINLSAMLQYNTNCY